MSDASIYSIERYFGSPSAMRECGWRAASRTATVCVRVEPEVKARAEDILDSLGLSLSDGVNVFLHRLVLEDGIPFAVKIPGGDPSCGESA